MDMRKIAVGIALAAAVSSLALAVKNSPTQPKETPSMTDPKATAVATFGGGCFWCMDAIFRELKGVATVESGFSGGAQPNPSYEAVCGGDTGHAEVIHIHYDPLLVKYEEL